MPVHDWTRVIAGTYHDFHSSWITHLKEALHGELLPEWYYDASEQHAGQVDVLTLEVDAPGRAVPKDNGGVAVATPPKVGRKVVASPSAAYRAARRTLAIRHASGHSLVALLE